MLRDVSLGQFSPGNTPLHRLDPRAKLLVLVLYITALFFCKTAWQYAAVAVWLIVGIAATRVPVKVLLKSLKPLLILMVFTAVLNMLTVPGRDLLPHCFLRVTEEGVVLAAKMVVRIVLMVCATFLLTYTTSPLLLTDALERAMGPLKLIKVPVHELAMMMSIALRFIPTLMEETDKIISAQKARGGDFESGNLVARVKALIPLLIPLIISAFRRAEELATAMECRCYHGGKGRTRLRALVWRGRDTAVVLGCLLAAAGVVAWSYVG